MCTPPKLLKLFDPILKYHKIRLESTNTLGVFIQNIHGHGFSNSDRQAVEVEPTPVNCINSIDSVSGPDSTPCLPPKYYKHPIKL